LSLVCIILIIALDYQKKINWETPNGAWTFGVLKKIGNALAISFLKRMKKKQKKTHTK